MAEPPPPPSLGTLHLRAVMAALAADEVSPAEVLEQCLSRLPFAQDCGAFVCVDAAGARCAVSRLDPRRRGPLYGVPVAVKDLVDVAGLPTAAGRSSGPIAVRDAPIVARLRAAGAIVVGKTRCDELGLATFTPGACDPRDPDRSPGGSSGGSALAVAVGAAVLAVATDTAGSARIPSAACGVAGLCASAAGLPGGGVVELSRRLDRLGLIAADGLDLELAWGALTGAAAGFVPVRVITLGADALGRVDADQLAAAASAALCLGSAVEVSGPPLGAFGADRAVVITCEAAALHPGGEAESAVVRRQLDAGARHTPAEVAAARRRLAALGDQLRVVVGDGLLVLPTLPGLPPRWSEVTGVDEQLRAIGLLTRLCGPVNSAGLVAASVPWWPAGAGRPIGVQLVAAHEATVLAAAAHLVRRHGDAPTTARRLRP